MRGHVRGTAATWGDRPYLLRAFERGPGDWVGEAWLGSSVAVVVTPSYDGESGKYATKAAAIEGAERELRDSIKAGLRAAAPVAVPLREVRVTAKHKSTGVTAAAWAPDWSSLEELEARFAPDYIVGRFCPEDVNGKRCRNWGQKEFGGRCYFHRDGAAVVGQKEVE